MPMKSNMFTRDGNAFCRTLWSSDLIGLTEFKTTVSKNVVKWQATRVFTVWGQIVQQSISAARGRATSPVRGIPWGFRLGGAILHSTFSRDNPGLGRFGDRSKSVRRSVRNRFEIGSKAVRKRFANRFKIGSKSVRNRFEIGSESRFWTANLYWFSTEFLLIFYWNCTPLVPQHIHNLNWFSTSFERAGDRKRPREKPTSACPFAWWMWTKGTFSGEHHFLAITHLIAVQTSKHDDKHIMFKRRGGRWVCKTKKSVALLPLCSATVFLASVFWS